MKNISCRLVQFVVVALLPAITLAQPAIDKTPETVEAVGVILDVDRIDSAEQNFTLNMYILFRWQDKAEAHRGPGNVIKPLSEVWNPRLTIINKQRVWTSTRDEVEITPDGTVTYRLNLFGDFSQPLELHDFPLDSHTFEVPVVAAGYRPHQLLIEPMMKMDSFMAERLSVADWHVRNVSGESRVVSMANGLQLPGFVLSFEADRLVHHYVVKAIIPLVLIVMMSWVVFWMDPEHVPNQLGVSVTTVLTLIAYSIALSSRLPEIPYLTRMDVFLFGATILVFASLIEVVVTSHLSNTDRLALARTIDRHARWVAPVLFIGVISYSFL